MRGFASRLSMGVTRVNRLKRDFGLSNPYSLSLDGVDDSVEVTGFPALSGFSVAGWIKPAAGQVSDFIRIIQRSNNSDLGFRIMLHQDARVEWWAAAGGDDSPRADADYTVGQWTHFAGTVDDLGGNYDLYINGVLQAATRSVSPVGDGTDLLSFGKTVGENTNFYEGLMDDLRIYNRALSGSEVSELYAGVGISPGPFGHWKFNEGSGSTALDSAGVNDGTITGATYSTDTPF